MMFDYELTSTCPLSESYCVRKTRIPNLSIVLRNKNKNVLFMKIMCGKIKILFFYNIYVCMIAPDTFESLRKELSQNRSVVPSIWCDSDERTTGMS